MKSLKFYGLSDSQYFYDKIQKNSLKIEDYNFIDVEGDGNYGYRALELQLYNDEANYNIIRAHLYNYFILNYDQYKNEYSFINNHLELGDIYIPKIQNDGFWIGDFELSIINLIYDFNLYIYERDIYNNLRLINIYMVIKIT